MNTQGQSNTPPAEQPIDMVLHCPKCGMQHIDTPEHWGGKVETHRSHLCVPAAGGCGYIWRPADVPTNGVAAVKTKGKNDSPPAEQQGEVEYLAGEVVGPCVCGSWPGGKCFKCPKIEQQGEQEPAAWVDKKGEMHRCPRQPIFGLVDDSCGSHDVLWSGFTFSDAIEAWKKISSKQKEAVTLTGYGSGVIADHDLMAWRHGERKGTFACPICGNETPHGHSGKEIAEHRDHEAWSQKILAERWKNAEERAAALEKQYPWYTPLYTHPSPSLIELRAKVEALPVQAFQHDATGRYDICHAHIKSQWLEVNPQHVEHYTIPLISRAEMLAEIDKLGGKG